MRSCPAESSDELKADLKKEREAQLRERFARTIKVHLLQVYAHDEDDLSRELLVNLDAVVGVDRKKMFLEALKEAISHLETTLHGGDSGHG